MANPPRFTPSFDFSDFEEVQPNTPKPGVQLDACFADLSSVTTGLRDAIVDVRRSDGALKNGIVTEDSLEEGLLETLTAATGADAINATAAEVDATAAEIEVTANDLQATLATLAASGGVSDWGTFDEPVTISLDWGTFP